MDNEPQDPEEYKRLMAQRRRNNTLMLLLIGAVIIVVVAFSGSTTAVFTTIGIFAVVAVLVGARAWLERRYHQRRKAPERSQQNEDREK